MDALYGWDSPHANFSALIGLHNTFEDMILNWFVLPTMFLVLPAFWVTALTWAGVHAGSFLQGLVVGSNDAKSAGSRGTAAFMRTVGGS
jgi:hypothetical protein